MANPAIYNVATGDSTAQPSELKLNGWSIPIQQGSADLSLKEIGERARSANATLGLSVLARKRSGDFKTPWWDPESIRALEGLVSGRGDVWPFDSSLYSGKGNYPTSATGARYRTAEKVYSYASTGSAIESGLIHPRFGSACLALDGATHNITPASLADGTSASALTDSSGSKVVNTGYGVAAPSGLSSAVKFTWTGSQTVYFNPLGTTFTASTDYYISFYILKAPSTATALSVTVAYDSGPTTIYSIASQAISTSIWTRVQLKVTPAGSGSFG